VNIHNRTESAMKAENNPLEAVRTMMIDTFEKSRSATQSYLDLFETTMRSIPNANEDQVGAFKAYVGDKWPPIMPSLTSFCAPRTFRKLSAFKPSTFSLS
jgi:hypothetical protein